MGRKRKGELPSGNVRIQETVGHGPNGERIRKSFTGKTREEAKAKYRLYMMSGEAEQKEEPSVLTVSGAVEKYIESKAAVLSPSTIADYKGILRRYLADSELGRMDIQKLTATDIQLWISEVSTGRSPKTVRNAHALFCASVQMFRPDYMIRSTLPAPRKPELYCPSDADVHRLLKECGDDRELKIAILLAAFGPLRRSEICALDASDLDGSVLTVNKAMVTNEDRSGWVIKQPKTYSSYRTIDLPPIVLTELRGIQGKFVTCSPDAITSRFDDARIRAGLPHFRFHDLRHYSASIMHAIGVPDQYIMQRGGWASDHVMKRVYRNAITEETQKQTGRILEHFSAVAT